MIRKSIIMRAYRDLAINSNLLLDDVTITEDNEVKGALDKDGYNNLVYIKFTKDFAIALVQYYDDACTTLEDIEIYRWSINEECYCKAEFV